MGIPPNPRSPPKDENLNQPPTIGRIKHRFLGGSTGSTRPNPSTPHEIHESSVHIMGPRLEESPLFVFFERLPAALRSLRPRVPQQLNSSPGLVGLEVPFKIMQILLSTQLQKPRTLFSLSYFRELFQFLKNTQSISEQDSWQTRLWAT